MARHSVSLLRLRNLTRVTRGKETLTMIDINRFELANRRKKGKKGHKK
jgi:hypothetical protein